MDLFAVDYYTGQKLELQKVAELDKFMEGKKKEKNSMKNVKCKDIKMIQRNLRATNFWRLGVSFGNVSNSG